MSEIDLFDEMGEIAAELDQLQRAREQFAAEQTAARFAAAAEARREDVDDERNRGPTPTEMERISAGITARVREESLAQLKEVMRAFLAEAASGAEGAAAAAVGEALAARFAAASPSFDHARAREGKTEAFGSPADAAVTREDGERRRMPRGRVGRTVNGDRRDGECFGGSFSVDSPSETSRNLRLRRGDEDHRGRRILGRESRRESARGVRRRAVRRRVRVDDIVDEIGHVSRVDATRSRRVHPRGIPRARRRRSGRHDGVALCFRPRPGGGSSLGLSRRSVRGGDGETRRGAASTSRATTRRASRRSRDETREDSRDGGGTRATRGGRRHRRRLGRERRSFPDAVAATTKLAARGVAFGGFRARVFGGD